MVSARNLVLLLALAASAAAQQCNDYWKGTAPFCSPTDDCDAGHKYNGVQDVRGDGARCVTGSKKLCQCIAPGGQPPICTPVLPPKQYTTFWGWVTFCDNHCKVYICGVKGFLFWKKRDVDAVDAKVVRRVYPR
ncbi:MAG: hypothetical protein Q9168_005238, partial [Polycauliona sp. 1 TL-2023]